MQGSNIIHLNTSILLQKVVMINQNMLDLIRNWRNYIAKGFRLLNLD